MVRTFYLIRHGETVFNAESRIQGQSDAPLSELGHRQAEAVAAALADAPVDAIFASPLRRALETARYLAVRLSLPIRTDPRLMELNAGVFEGRLCAELEAENSPEFVGWLAGGDDFVIPGGESRSQLADRGCDALRSLAAEGHRTTVVVTHGGWLSATLKSLLCLPQPLPPFAFQNGSITRLAVDPQGRFSLLALNETGHLRAIS
ncbi:MAG: histidine phosphatase family protein [Thermoguttaceae bacterium]